MDRITAALIAFVTLFALVFLGDYMLVKRRYLKQAKKNKKKHELTEIAYLGARYNLNKERLATNNILILFSCINAFIIALVSVTILLINIHIIFQLLIGFVLLFALIYSLYEILARILLKRGYDKNWKRQKSKKNG